MNSEPIWPGLILGLTIFLAILLLLLQFLKPALRDEDDVSAK
jgi:hypothetical protein